MAARSSPSPAAELFETTDRDGSRWRGCLDRYKEVVSYVNSQKKRSKGDGLALLDEWYEHSDSVAPYRARVRCFDFRFQKELPSSISSRSKPHLTHEELCKLMKWKLTVLNHA